MKKLLIVLIYLVVVCGAGLPIVNGIIMERTIKSAVVKNNTNAATAGTNLKIEILKYDRGLFSSRVTWRIENPQGVPGGDMGQLVLETQGRHGLFSVNAHTNLQENPWYLEWMNTHLDGKDPLSIQTRFSIAGTMDSTLQTNAFSIEDKGKKIDFHALNLNISMEKNFKTMDATCKWEGLSQGNEVILGPVTFTSDLYQLTDMLWAGKNTVSLTQLKINDGKSDPLDLSGLAINFDTRASEDKKSMTMTMDFHLDRIEMGGKPLSDWTATLKLKQIDTAAFEQGIILYSKMMTQAGQQLERTGSDPGDFQKILKASMARNTPQLMLILKDLLKKDLGMEITNLDIDLPEGKIIGNLDLNLKKDLDPSNIFVFAMQPDMLFSFFNLDAQLGIPYALGGGIPTLTRPLFPGMATGLFVVKDDTLSLDMHIRDEQLFLNGNQVILKQ